MARLSLQSLVVCLLTATTIATTALAGQPPQQDPNEFLEIGGYVLKSGEEDVSPVRFFRSNGAGSVLIVSPAFDAVFELAPAQSRNRVIVFTPDAFTEPRQGVFQRKASASPSLTGTFKLAGSPSLPTFEWRDKTYAMRLKPPLLGPQSQESIVEYDPSWGLRSKLYEPYAQYLNPLLDVQQDVVIKVYFGSWCNHCQDLVPKIFKVEQQLVNSKIRFEYHGLPLDVKKDPEAEAYGITGSLPFGVIFVDGEERTRTQGLSWRFPDLAITTALLKPAKN